MTTNNTHPMSTTKMTITFGRDSINLKIYSLAFAGKLAYYCDINDGGEPYSSRDEYYGRHKYALSYALLNSATASQRKRIVAALGSGASMIKDEFGEWRLRYNNGIDRTYDYMPEVNFAGAEGSMSAEAVNAIISRLKA